MKRKVSLILPPPFLAPVMIESKEIYTKRFWIFTMIEKWDPNNDGR